MSTRRKRTAQTTTEETVVEAPVEVVTEENTVKEDAVAEVTEVQPQEPFFQPQEEEVVVVEKDVPVVKVVQPTAEYENQVAKQIVLELNQYAEAVAPGKYVGDIEGGAQQLKFYRLIQRAILRTSHEDFKPVMDAVLTWFKDNSTGVTSDAYRNRFAASWSSAREDYEAFTRLSTLLSLLADGKSRNRVVKEINFEFYLAYGVPESARERLLAYFGQ